ncbi:hypothetical protein HNR42_000449 [Deinobacterium chartae]|uniref:DUF4253 domain-containing protein n=1 Tax=Deinobacterium chartae TaxID=521158 RepID=A0A841HZ68_9DEIO|nr:DUF4253 domain-containing protein [Deinobacterium chartae]MBB6097035.1 hypothetical protein [Deinobacterium chartae]
MPIPQALLHQIGFELAHLTERALPAQRQLYTFCVPGREAVSAWRALRAAFPETGLWPLITGEGPFEPDDAFPEDGGRALLEAARRLDLQAWLRRRLEEDARDDDPDGAQGPITLDPVNARLFAEDVPAPQGGPRPLEEGLTSVRDPLSWSPLREVWMLLLPVQRCWEVHAVLGYGGWNDYPEPEVHVALMQRWNARYGAEPVALTRDVVELWAPRPLQDPAEALVLASEQYAYCGDVVWQGTESVPNLAGALLDNEVWYFWWD